MTAIDETLAPLSGLAREVRAAGAMLGTDQARSLVDTYYRLQEHRIALDGQTRALDAAGKPTAVVSHFAAQMRTLERQMTSVLDVYSRSTAVGTWSRAQLGIGPVLASGLMAHIDIEKAPTVGHIWRFAGLDPTVTWEKGHKRPWNADLKVLCWKIGDSFVKVSGRQDALYGQAYVQRKAYEVERDARGGNAEAAARQLAERRISDKALRQTLESGHLAPGRLDARARRWAVKLYLSHWHHVAYLDRYGEPPPKPYVLTQEGGHAHYIAPPGLEP